MKTILKYLKSQRGDFIVTPILAGLATVGGASGAIGGGLAVASTAASIGTGIASATKREPGAKIVGPPSVAQAREGRAQEVMKRRRGLGFKDTILSNALNQVGAGGKTMLGQQILTVLLRR